MTTETDVGAAEFLTLARQALRSSAGGRVLDSLGWWDLLGQLTDRTMRSAVFALFRAEGRELASTPALGGLLAQPYLELIGAEPGEVVAAVTRTSRARGQIAMVFDDVSGRKVLLDRPGMGLTVFDGDRLIGRRVDVPGRLRIDEIDLDSPGTRLDVPDELARRARLRSVALGRLAMTAEMLGAAEGTVEIAVAHVSGRDQFGQPIGRFQAVRHLLAWAETDCVALAAVVDQATWFGDGAPAGYDEVAKALGGRNARRACERSLQVLGAIGFTAEFPHHHYHGRVLLLDGLLGTSAELTNRLGAQQRESSRRPDLTSKVLAEG